MSQAVQRAVRARYFHPRTTSIVRAPILASSVPAFAFIEPAKYIVTLPPPGEGLHPTHAQHDSVALGTEVVLVVLFVAIVLIGPRQQFVRICAVALEEMEAFFRALTAP